jgi:hypothetical protein
MLNIFKCLIIILAIATLGCKKSGPGFYVSTLCDSLQDFRATATINEIIEGSSRTVEVDTIVNFQALLQARSNAPTNAAVGYEWLVSNNGSQPTSYTQPTLLLRFGPEQIGERIDVILIAKRGGVPLCPNEDRLDTVWRSFYVYTNNKADTLLHRPFIIENRITGSWLGSYIDEPERKFVVTIADFGFSPTLDSTTHYGLRLFNMPEGCGNRPSWVSNPCAFALLPSSYSHPIDYGGSSLVVSQRFTNDCRCTPISLYGYIPYNHRDSLVIDAQFYQPATGNVERNRQWKGKRL